MKFLLKMISLCLIVFSSDALAQEARKIEELDSYRCEDTKVKLFDLIVQLNDSPSSKGYIIGYEGQYPSYEREQNGSESVTYRLPRVGELNSKFEILRKTLLFGKFDLGRIVFVNGGFREKHKVEFWVVSNGAKPSLEPALNKMKFRKGKPPKFTFWDC